MKPYKMTNRYGDKFTFTPQEDGTILWEGNFEYSRIGYPNDYTKAFFEYTRDTLIVEVVEQGGALFLKEYYTNNSPMYIDTFISNDPILYPVEGIEDNVLIPERAYSSLFYFYGNDTIRFTSTTGGETLTLTTNITDSDNDEW